MAIIDPVIRQGQSLAQSKGCIVCHSVDGSAGVGPTWSRLFDKTGTLEGGEHVVADHAYLARSIRAPQAQIVNGFAPIMPVVAPGEAGLFALLA